MSTEDADDLVRFSDVRVLRTTAPALFCRVGSKNVWLPRRHVSGKLWCTGDRGQLYIRRWLAWDRQLVDSPPVGIPSPVAAVASVRLPVAPARLPVHLHLVYSAPAVVHGK
jgi:hypothetical protein